MNSLQNPAAEAEKYRRILGVQFFVGDAREAIKLGTRGGLVVVPAAPALVELGRDGDYREALVEADLVLTDSGFMVLLWNLIMRDHIHRVSGLEYLHLLLEEPELKQAGSVLWVMPSKESSQRNANWLKSNGYPVQPDDCYIAPKYSLKNLCDPALVKLIDERKPRHVVIGVGGGTQEKLGLHLKRNCQTRPAIHCIGAAIGFLSGDQVHIPLWADQMILGWLFRCASNPRRFIPRYLRAFHLARVLWRYRSRMPDVA